MRFYLVLAALLLSGNYFCCNAYDLDGAVNLGEGTFNKDRSLMQIVRAAGAEISIKFKSYVADSGSLKKRKVPNTALTFSGAMESCPILLVP